MTPSYFIRVSVEMRPKILEALDLRNYLEDPLIPKFKSRPSRRAKLLDKFTICRLRESRSWPSIFMDSALSCLAREYVR